MKHKILPLILFTLVLFSSTFAAEQIGTMTSSEAFELAGTQIPASAARSVPLMNRDKVKTTTSIVIIMLEDGSRIAVDKNSTLRLQRLGEEMLLCLEEGALRFNAAEGSRLVVCALTRRIELQALSEGTVSITGPDEVLANVEKGASVVVIEDATCTCEPGRKLLPLALVIVTAGVGTTVGIAVLGGDEPPPPPLPPRSPF